MSDTDQDHPRGPHLAPFRGLRFVREHVGSLAAVTSPPYDVVVRPDGQRHLETADPYNVVRLILPDAATPDAQHRKAARTLAAWLDQGVLAPDPAPALYVYEQRDGDHLQRGVIGALRLSGPEEGAVLPHEDVMPGPVADRAALMRATGANLEPLLLAYRDGPATARVIDRTHTGTKPLLATTTEDGVRHRLWALTDPADLTTIDAELAARQALIADGHHRWATYRRLQATHPPGTGWDYGLVLLVDTTHYPLRVRAIHRVLPELAPAAALAAARDVFRVRRLPDDDLDGALEALAEASAEAGAEPGTGAEPATGAEPGTEPGTGGRGASGPRAEARAKPDTSAGGRGEAGPPAGAPGTGGNAFLLAGDGFHLLDRPDPARLRDAVPDDRPEPWQLLDATVLHSLLLDRVWRVPDSPDHIRYIHDAEAAVHLARQLGGTAVLMHPVREQIVLGLARQGVMMPRKSTSFGPKPASGLVMRSVELE